MKRNQTLIIQKFCACGNKAYTRKSGAFVCERCHKLEQKMDNHMAAPKKRVVAVDKFEMS